VFTVIALPAAVVMVTPAVVALCANIGTAIQRAQIKQKSAAEDMGLSEPRLSEAVNATSPLDVRRLAVLGEKNPAFWRELIDVLAKAHGLTVVRADVADLISSVDTLVQRTRRTRMAKASLPADAKQVAS
jgi:Mg-chelatase subunit ChlI